MDKQKGVTLIELMVVVAVIGLLTAIAYPSYQDHVLKSYRNQAQSDLMMIQLALEEKRTAGVKYNTFNGISHANIQAQLCRACEDNNRYKYTIASTATSYTITAEKQSNQSVDSCADLTLMHSGESGPSGCWK